MAKVAETVGGAALIAAGVVLDVMTVGWATPALPYIFSAGASMLLGGLAGLVAGSPQPGVSMGEKDPIGVWGYIYGRNVKVGGTIIFDQCNSSQGTSNNKQLHRVYALGCHTTGGDLSLRIDGQILPVNHSGTQDDGDIFDSYSPSQANVSISSISRAGGLVTINLTSALTVVDGQNIWIHGVADNSFNGTFLCSATSPTQLTCTNGGPDTTSSGGEVTTTLPDYSNKIHFETQYGGQLSTFVGLLASGTQWTTTDVGRGRTMGYTRFGYDDAYFASVPNVSWVFGQGKNDIYDPRTGTRGVTSNAALCIADFMCLPIKAGGFGMQIGTNLPGLYIDEASLSAAANICDEAVSLAAGGTQPRYELNGYIALSKTRGAILNDMLAACAGRITREGGCYRIFPGAWVGSTFSATLDDMRGPIKIKPLMSARDICNGVKGVYISPSNDYQQADFPAYAQDANHGYASDANQAMDGGDRIWLDVQMQCVNTSAQAQRIAKIELKRRRYQMRCTVRLSMRAFSVIALDVIDITFARYNWVNKLFEVLTSRIVVEKGTEDSAPSLCMELELAETGPDVYDWFTTEEMASQGYKSPALSDTRVCPYPEQVLLYSGPGATINGVACPSTISTTASGIAQNSAWVNWLAPNDGYVINGGKIEVSYQRSGDAGWTAFGTFDPSITSCFIPHLSDGDVIYARVRAINVAGTPSNWVIAGPETITETLSVLAYSGVQVAPDGTLGANAFSDGTASISIVPFTATVASQTANVTSPTSPITGLKQGQIYDVYYVDPYFAGGSVTPIATQNSADYINKAGYFLIGSIVTPNYSSGGSGATVWYPSTYTDVGNTTTTSPDAPYSLSPSTFATVNAATSIAGGIITPSVGECVWLGFPNTTPTGDDIYVTFSAALLGSGGSGSIDVSFDGGSTWNNITSIAATTAQTTVSLAVPAGKDLQNMQVSVSATPGSANGNTTKIKVYDIHAA